METLKNSLNAYDRFEKRSALYYLTRYIKQAKIFNKYKKDIFIDGLESYHSEKVQNLTLEMIDIIEDVAKKKAIDFTDKEFNYWMDTIAELEDNIDIELSEELTQKALNEILNFKIPSKTNNNCC